MRDLRRRWLQVLATALVIAIGVAVFAGMGGMRSFREQSAQRSFDVLKFHDLRLTLADGSFAREGEMKIAIAGARADAPPAAVEERLLVPTQVDGRPLGRDLLTPGLVIGVPVAARDVDLVRAIRGRNLAAADAARPVAVLDRSYAKFYELPDTGRLKLAGGASIDYVGQGQSPQYFLITSGAGFGGESTLGVLYTPLAAAQKLAGRAGAVNELVMRLAAGADPERAKRAVERVAAARFPGAEVTMGDDEPSHTILFRDAKNDQRMLSFFGLLVLLGASIAAFNLVSRTVEAERREIGVGMALGVPTAQLALRPLMLGAQIALAGTVLGALLSAWVANVFGSLMEELMPLPVYTEPFTAGVFVRGATVGFLLPFAATLWPVWRGVRVQPVEAIRVTARSASGGLVRAATRLRLPGGAVAQMPWRNTSRTPRRTLLAVVGLAAVIGAMTALVGLMDSFNRTIELSRAELTGDAPGRLNVALTGFLPEHSAAVRKLSSVPGVREVETRLDLPSALVAGSGSPVDVVLTTIDRRAGVWKPTITAGRLPAGANEIVIAPKAAKDLGVKPGDRVQLRVAGFTEGGKTELKSLKLKIAGLTSDPFRVFAYADRSLAADAGMLGMTNALSVMPAAGANSARVQRSLASSPVVATTRPVTADADALADTMEQFKGIIQVAAAAAFVLAVLMAFNLAGIALEERRREYATMFAFGLPVRRGLRIASTENLIIGLLGTALGVAVGLLTIGWIVGSLTADTWPEIGIERHLSASSAVVAVFVGVIAVAVTPYLLSRRLLRMDIPSTLRVME